MGGSSKKAKVQQVNPVNDEFAKRMRDQAFKTPEASRLARESELARNEQEGLKAQSTANAADARSQQQDFINQLQQQASGQGTSQAQRELTDASSRQKAGLAAQLASRVGFSGGANARAAARAAATIQRNAAQQNQQLKAQDQINAQKQLANQTTQLRQQDVQQQQAAQAGQLSGLKLEQGLQEQQQQARANAASAAINRNLAEQGGALQADIARIQQKNAQSNAIGAAIGTAAGAAIGGPAGASLGGSIGGSGAAAFNKGGVVPKMSKEKAFGHKKAQEAKKEQSTDRTNYALGGMFGNSGSNKMFANILKKAEEEKRLAEEKNAKINSKIEDATTAVGEKDRQYAAKNQTATSKADAKTATANAASARSQQAALADQLRARQSGATPSITSMQTKANAEKSLAQQLANQGRARRAMSPTQVAAQAQQQAIAQQQAAGQAGLQEQNQNTGLLGQNLAQTRGLDITQENFSRQMAQQQLAQEQAVRESQRGLNQQDASLTIRQIQAEQALQNQAAAAPGRKKFLGLFNEGGKIPGKAKVKGDDIKNDTVPALLSPGEIVIPRTVVEKGNEAMMGFIKGLESKSKKPKKKVQKLNKGGEVEESEEKKKKADNTMAIASAAGQFIGGLAKQKREAKEQKRLVAKREFDEALRGIKGLSKFAKGGKVDKMSYGKVLQAKKQLDENLKKMRK